MQGQDQLGVPSAGGVAQLGQIRRVGLIHGGSEGDDGAGSPATVQGGRQRFVCLRWALGARTIQGWVTSVSQLRETGSAAPIRPGKYSRSAVQGGAAVHAGHRGV